MNEVKKFIDEDEIATLLSANDNEVVFKIAYAEISDNKYPSEKEIDLFSNNLKKEIYERFSLNCNITTFATDEQYLEVNIQKQP